MEITRVWKMSFEKPNVELAYGPLCHLARSKQSIFLLYLIRRRKNEVIHCNIFLLRFNHIFAMKNRDASEQQANSEGFAIANQVKRGHYFTVNEGVL